MALGVLHIRGCRITWDERGVEPIEPEGFLMAVAVVEVAVGWWMVGVGVSLFGQVETWSSEELIELRWLRRSYLKGGCPRAVTECQGSTADLVVLENQSILHLKGLYSGPQ